MHQKTAQDWPYLKKYEKANSKLPTLKVGQERIVFIGDSITEFWSELCPEFFVGKPYVNRGISGQTSPQMLLRFRADVVALKPTKVILLAGANDIAENTGPSTLEMIMDNIISMIDIAKSNHIQVIVCSLLPVIDFWWRQGLQPSQKVVCLNKIIKSYADANQIIYVDYYAAMVNVQNGLNSLYTDDGVHPNKNGYKVMNKLLEKVI